LHSLEAPPEVVYKSYATDLHYLHSLEAPPEVVYKSYATDLHYLHSLEAPPEVVYKSYVGIQQSKFPSRFIDRYIHEQ
jgi:hypothetical protein